MIVCIQPIGKNSWRYRSSYFEFKYQTNTEVNGRLCLRIWMWVDFKFIREYRHVKTIFFHTDIF